MMEYAFGDDYNIIYNKLFSDTKGSSREISNELKSSKILFKVHPRVWSTNFLFVPCLLVNNIFHKLTFHNLFVLFTVTMNV